MSRPVSILPPRRRIHPTGSALVITLAFLVLVVVLVLGLFTIVRTERVTANSNFETQRAKALANLGADNAVALLQEATAAGSAPRKFWASQPGKITVFNADGSLDAASSRLLYSTNATGGIVDLNQAGFRGVPPIVTATAGGSGSPPSMEVNWVPVLENPLLPASGSNKLIGRYAFWVDDETAKLNVNTADGTGKYSNQSFGAGMPTEASLTALTASGSTLSVADAQAIANQSGARYGSATPPRPFNAPSEVLQAPGIPASFIQDNAFNITHYSRSPELNIFGEPRIYLVTTATTGAGGSTVLNAMLGDYSGNGTTLNGSPMMSVYPDSKQLPPFSAPGVSKPLPQYFVGATGVPNKFDTTSADYEMGMRIARYLKGFDGQGNAIQWPLFPGAASNGFAGKYTDRQIDSIALQILTLLKKGTFADQFKGYALPDVMPKGFLSGKLVRGLSFGPRVNEIWIRIETAYGSTPMFNMKIVIEWVLPKEFGGELPAAKVSSWQYGSPYNSSFGNVINAADSPARTASMASVTTASPLGGYWMDNMIKVYDQTGDIAGIDFCGNNPNVADPDPRSSTYHPSAGGKGTGPRPNSIWPIFEMRSISPNAPWKAGDYRSTRNFGYDYSYPMKPGTTSITLGGGLAIGGHSEGGSAFAGFNLDPVPLDSLRGPYTGETLSDPAVRTAVLEAVLPLPNISIPVPGSAVIHMQVADPLVNSFPGDWIITVNPPDSQITMTEPTDAPATYTNGQNAAARPSASGDPQSFWWPPLNTSSPKSNRFPSVGYLQYIRTGMMPDKANESKPLAEQKGTPYRMLNLAPSTDSSQRTNGGTSYPDWAMLDLFTVPASVQAVASPLPAPVHFTWGGATSGRLNANTLILPFSSVARHAPLRSAFKGLRVSNSYDASENPVTTTIDEVALSAAVGQYLSTLNRPFMMPAEICNVPEVADSLYQGVAPAARSRNDLVRQVVGNLTTRSNTFSIWAIGQVVKKAPKNTQYGTYESGDILVGESRIQILVERVLDYGADGTPGNSQNPGPDGVIGTPDDPIDPVYHPAMTYPLPYKLRVISAREVTN